MKLISFQSVIVALLAMTSLQAVSSEREQLLYRIGEEERMSLEAVAGVARSDKVSYPGASYISVYFSSFDLPDGDSVVVRSPNGETSFEYTNLGRGDLGRSGGFFSSRVPGDEAIVEYKTNNKGEGTGVRYEISKFVRGFGENTVDSICGPADNSKPAKCYLNGSVNSTNMGLPMAYAKSQSIARLFINSSFLCTGWMVGSEGHMITNNHCISTPAEAALVDVEFEAESKSCTDECKTGLGCPGKVIAMSTELITTSEEHDYALLKLPAAVISHVMSKYKFLQMRPTGPKLREFIYVPQHPRGWAKRIASVVDSIEVPGRLIPAYVQTVHGTTGCGENQVGYQADTQGGSSGSPLMAVSDNAVIALHHCGGCENNAVDITDVIKDLNEKKITIKDMYSAPLPIPPTPAPTRSQAWCKVPKKWMCQGLVWCKWSDADGKCYHK